MRKHIRYREEEKEITLKTAYVTEQEWLEAGAVENKSIAELQIKFSSISTTYLKKYKSSWRIYAKML